MHGYLAPGRNLIGGSSAADDVGMGQHQMIMQFALQDCKRLLRYPQVYAAPMSDPADRLKAAREHMGFGSAVDAADALGVPRQTYISHENGSRGITAKRAILYARRFKISEDWLLYGKGNMHSETAEIIDLWSRIPEDRRIHAKEVLETFTDGRAVKGSS